MAPPPLAAQSHIPQSSPLSKETRGLYCLLATSLVSVLFVLSFSYTSSPSPSSSSPPSSSTDQTSLLYSSASSLPKPPSLAYLISGSNGEGDRILRLLFAIYHPKNVYLLHLDLSSPQEQRERLAFAVEEVPVFKSIGNVYVIGNASYANPRGSSVLASILHSAALLLKLAPQLDWFVNLDASDYPLITQDDLLHILSFLPRDLNFVEHTSIFGQRELRRLKPVIVDPGLYLSAKTDIFYGTQKREVPDAFRFFAGSASVILSREFIEFSILGTDNLPRALLLYFANTRSPHNNYFHTVLCNSLQFNKTIVNHNLHYLSWDVPPKSDPRVLGVDNLDNMTRSSAAFGSGFSGDDAVLDLIDKELLNRPRGKVVPGGWCLGGITDPCTVWGDADVILPGPGAKRLERKISHLLSTEVFHSRQCVWD